MLAFERHVVAALTTASAPDHRRAVADWVDATLRDMPQHLRAGVMVESHLLHGWWRLRAAGGRTDVAALLAKVERSPVAFLRQYLRLFGSLVLFAELELEPEPTPVP